MRYTIEVTQRDIDQADLKNSSRCVVATAIARSIPGSTHIDVDVQTTRFSVGGERFAYVTPYGVAGYIVAFDAGDEIHPFKFRLDDERSVNVRQRQKTPAGKALDRANTAAQRKAKQADKAQQKLVDLKQDELAPPSPAEVKAAKATAELKKQEAAAAKTERDEVIAAYADQRKSEADLSLPKAPPRVFKKKARHYGHRVLRINQ